MIVNRETGQEPTPTERQAIEQRAIEILQNPYASPEQMQWAIEAAPPGFEVTFWESCQQAAVRKHRQTEEQPQ